MPVEVPTRVEFDDLDAAIAAQVQDLDARLVTVEQSAPPDQSDVVALQQAVADLTTRVDVLETSGSGTAGFPKLWTAGDNTIELVDRLYLTQQSPYNITPVAVVHLTDVKAGDILDIDGEFQVSTGSAYVRMIGSVVFASAVGPAPNSGIEVREHQTTNITFEIHHLPVRRSGKWVADQDYPDLYVSLCGYAAHTGAASGAYTNVDQDYARLDVVQHRPA